MANEIDSIGVDSVSEYSCILVLSQRDKTRSRTTCARKAIAKFGEQTRQLRLHLYFYVSLDKQISLEARKLHQLLKKQSDVACAHHISLGADVRARSQDDHKAQVVGHLQEGHEISLPVEVEAAFFRLVATPLDEPACFQRESIAVYACLLE